MTEEEQGFSIVETIVTIALIGVVVVPLVVLPGRLTTEYNSGAFGLFLAQSQLELLIGRDLGSEGSGNGQVVLLETDVIELWRVTRSVEYRGNLLLYRVTTTHERNSGLTFQLSAIRCCITEEGSG